jgi:hypothetical protein
MGSRALWIIRRNDRFVVFCSLALVTVCSGTVRPLFAIRWGSSFALKNVAKVALAVASTLPYNGKEGTDATNHKRRTASRLINRKILQRPPAHCFTFTTPYNTADHSPLRCTVPRVLGLHSPFLPFSALDRHPPAVHVDTAA